MDKNTIEAIHCARARLISKIDAIVNEVTTTITTIKYKITSILVCTISHCEREMQELLLHMNVLYLNDHIIAHTRTHTYIHTTTRDHIVMDEKVL